MTHEIPPWWAVIGFGGNIGTESQIVERFGRAREAFAQYGRVWSAPLYRTAPIGPDQPPFLNSAVAVEIFDGQPEELVAMTREIELLLGRDRRGEERWGPRKIDLDILVWGTRVVRSLEIELPHPRLAERRFALEPLVMLTGPTFLLPGTETRLSDLLKKVDAQRVELVATTW